MSIKLGELQTLKRGESQLHDLSIRISLKNSGQSPAKQVEVDISPFEGMTLALPEMRSDARHTMNFGDVAPVDTPTGFMEILMTEDRMRWMDFGKGDSRFWLEINVAVGFTDVFGCRHPESAKFFGWCSPEVENTLARSYEERIEPNMWGPPEAAG